MRFRSLAQSILRLHHLTLRSYSSDSKKSLFDLLKTMKVDSTTEGKNVYLFEGPRLEIFNQKSASSQTPTIPVGSELWNELEQEELEKRFCRSPENAFEEMIRLTKEGKLWSYPINNEQGLETNREPFHRHIFFQDLMIDLPEKGPLRDFMNLVAMGLGKNPTMNADRKRECFVWYKNYFKENEDILQHVDMELDEDH